MKAQTVKNAVIVPVGREGRVRREARRHADRVPDLHPRPARAHRQPGRRRGRRAARAWCGATATTPTSSSRPTRAPARSPTSPTSSRPSTATGSATRSRRVGPPGFDHKEMGITSRGAWISVQAHFRALGVDADTARADRRRHRRHVGRRVRQRSAPVAAPAAGRRVRPPARVRRSRSRSGGELRRAPAPVRAADVVVGRLRPRGAVAGRRRVPARRPSRSTCQPAARRVLGVDDGALTPDELVQRRAARARRPAVERRDRHVREGDDRVRRRRRRPHQRRGAHRRDRAAVPRRRRGRQPRVHPTRAGRVRARRRAHQHRRHRQLGRRRLLRPRGEHQDPACSAPSPPASSRPTSATRCSWR